MVWWWNWQRSSPSHSYALASGLVVGQWVIRLPSLIITHSHLTLTPHTSHLTHTHTNAACNCVSAGTVNTSQVCEKAGGQCDCKLGVGGRDCGQCLPGYYDLSPLREEGCLECDCFIGGSVSQTCDGTTGDCFCRNNIGGSVPNSEGREVVGCTTPLPGHFCHGLALVYEAEGEEVASPSVVQGAPSDLFTGSGFVRLLVSQSEAIEGVAVPFSGEYDVHIRHGPPQTVAQRVSVRLRAVTDPQSNSTPPCSPPAVDREEMVELSSTASSFPVFTVCLLAGAEYTISLTALDAEVLVDSVIATPTLEQGAAGQLEVFQNQSALEAYLTSGCHLDHIMVGGASMLPDEAFCERLTCSATFQLFNGAVGEATHLLCCLLTVTCTPPLRSLAVGLSLSRTAG